LRWRPLSDWRSTSNVDKVIEAFDHRQGRHDCKAIAALTKLKPAAAALPTTEQLETRPCRPRSPPTAPASPTSARIAAQLKLDRRAHAQRQGRRDHRRRHVGQRRPHQAGRPARGKHEESVGPIVAFSGGTQTYDNPDFRRDALATAFAHRARPDLVKLTDQAKPFATHSILEIAAETVRARGIRVSIGDRDGLVVHAMHSSSDFPYILGNVLNKILLPSYMAAAANYRLIAAQRNFNDFRAHNFVRLGDFPDLLKVDEDGEVKAGTISEGKEAVTMYAYGRRIAFHRQMLINDDLSAFTDMAALAGIRVANFENATVFAVITANSGQGPTMTDNAKLFSTTHANYTSTGTAVNLPAELGLMRAKMRKQTGLDGVKINLAPKYLLVGPDNETAAEQVTTQTSAQQASNVNKVGPSLTPVVDANISGYGWNLFADPAMAPAIIYGSLPGQTGPRVMTREGWSVEGVEFKVMRDFGTGAIDHRPATFNAGAAPS
jgi:hypothetical protein